MITNKELRDAFISPNIQYYLHQKLKPTDPEEVDVRTEELVKYLKMSIHFGGGIPFSESVDDVWHYWIMETEEYFKLCQNLHGKGYIHHSSNDFQEFTDKNIKSQRPDFDSILTFFVAYVLNYGPFDERRIKYWPLAEKLIEAFNWNVDQFNQWLTTILNENSTVSKS